MYKKEYKFRHHKKHVATVYELDDLLDDKNELFAKNNNFGTWDELFKKSLKNVSTKKMGYNPKSRLTMFMVKAICRVFFKLLMDDLIYRNETFYYPKIESMWLKIAWYRRTKRRDAPRFRFYHLCSYQSEAVDKKFKRVRYYCQMAEGYGRKLAAELKKKHEYEKFEITSNVLLRDVGIYNREIARKNRAVRRMFGKYLRDNEKKVIENDTGY